MIKKEFLTNERLKGLFINNFDLANYAIELARNYIKNEDPHSLNQLIDELAEINKEKQSKNNQ